MTNRASEDMRRANKRAISSRDKWRNQYEVVTSVIRNLKASRTANPDNRAVQLELEIMKSFATFMMDERFGIRMDLIHTAYKYVDKVS